MGGLNGGWDPSFPFVMCFVGSESVGSKPWKILESHPDYDAAKNHEDREAAKRLVTHFLDTPENAAKLETLGQKFPSSIIVSVHALEANVKNQIPQILSDYIGKLTGLEVDDNIIQTNRVHRTGTDEWHRFAFRPTFGGDVKAGHGYILVDDVFSLGGSFNELRRFIEFHGGKVVQAIAMATGRSGPEIALNPNTLKNLVDRYGKDKLQSFLKEIDLYAGNCQALTEPEARALRRAPSLDEARNRVLAARQAGLPPVGPESLQKPEAPKIEADNIKAKKPCPKRGFHR
jgi:hypothetical protein